MDRRTSCKTIVLIKNNKRSHTAHRTSVFSVLPAKPPDSGEKSSSSSTAGWLCAACAAGLPKEGAQYCVVW
eukprot:COSAG01_NODE_77_length_28297_cov_104.096230_22_plen_71_part_00